MQLHLRLSLRLRVVAGDVFVLTCKLGRGKSGPLFHFDVHEDVRTVNDARIEKDESHAGKIVERHW